MWLGPESEVENKLRIRTCKRAESLGDEAFILLQPRTPQTPSWSNICWKGEKLVASLSVLLKMVRTWSQLLWKQFMWIGPHMWETEKFPAHLKIKLPCQHSPHPQLGDLIISQGFKCNLTPTTPMFYLQSDLWYEQKLIEPAVYLSSPLKLSQAFQFRVLKM